jgi:VanZ family protein
LLSAWIPVVAFAALIFKLSSIPMIDTRDAVSNIDKLAHLLEYGLFGGLLARAFARSGLVRHGARILVVLMAGAAVAALDEIFQGLVGRTQSAADWGTDLVAVLLAACLDAWLRSRHRDPHWIWRDDGPAERTGGA